jgi:hypothetical protein
LVTAIAIFACLYRDSERGLEWRCADSVSDAFELADQQHAWLSRTRSRLPLELHEQVFTWALRGVPQKSSGSHRTVSCGRVMRWNWAVALPPLRTSIHASMTVHFLNAHRSRKISTIM